MPPLFDQKAVGIKQEYGGKQHHDPVADLKHQCDAAAAKGVGQSGVVEHRLNDKKYSDHQGAGQQIGDVVLLVFADAVDCEFAVKSSFHFFAPPVVRMVRACEIF